jgi:hypothetical protein
MPASKAAAAFYASIQNTMQRAPSGEFGPAGATILSIGSAAQVQPPVMLHALGSDLAGSGQSILGGVIGRFVSLA